MNDTDTTAQAPTCDLDAERALLGAMMLNPAAITDLPHDAWYRPQHGDIAETIRQLHGDGHPTDPVAVVAHLADAGEISRLGGAEAIHDCMHVAAAPAQASWYADRILQLHHRRQVQAAGIRLTQAATAPGADSVDLAAVARQIVDDAQVRRRSPQMHHLGSLVNPGIEDIETRRDRPKGLPTGFADLDQLLGGLAPTQLVTVAAPTGAGKSVFLLDIARHVAIRQQLTVAAFSLEMSKEEIFDRTLAAEAGVRHSNIRDGKLTDDDWSRIARRLSPMSNAPLWISDAGHMTVDAIANRARELREHHGALDMVVVDHLHLVASQRRNVDEFTRITEISRGLKTLAMDLEVPVVAAAQFNRAVAARSDKTPRLDDLKNSSSIEQDSNVVLMLHRDDYHQPDSPRLGEVDVIVAKNRSGPKDTVVCAGQWHLSRIVDMARGDAA